VAAESFPLFPEIQELRVKGWVKVRSISLEEEGPQGTPPQQDHCAAAQEEKVIAGAYALEKSYRTAGDIYFSRSARTRTRMSSRRLQMMQCVKGLTKTPKRL
jgi:hypothetical protein